MSTKMKRTTLYLTPSVYQWLANKAHSQRRSISSMAECLIDSHRQDELNELLEEVRKLENE